MTDTIIIADISEASTVRTRAILSELGYHPHAALSAAEALQACRKLNPAVVNILENAVDACVADAKGKNEHRVLLKVQCGSDAIGISVEDNGNGMTSDQLKKLFTVFYSTKGIKGTGLGLFIADKIVRQHGGDMVVELSLGQGSRFCIRLPSQMLADAAPGSSVHEADRAGSCADPAGTT